MGSPPASAARGSAVEETNAICLLSGDQEKSLPVPGKGLLVPCGSARNVTSDPSGRTTNSPPWSPWCPEKAIHLPSGDHTPPPPPSLSPPTRTDFWLDKSMIHNWPYGRPGRSLRTTV